VLAVGLSLVLLASPTPSDVGALGTFAAASPRSALCRPASLSDEGRLWTQVRGGSTRRYCLLLAWGYARLVRSPKSALDLAREASALSPAEVEPRVLEGRAWLRLGEWDAAYAALTKSVTAKGRPLGDVLSLRELGVAAVVTGRLSQAIDVYRALVTRVGFSNDPAFARLSVLEAAAALMAAGPANLSDATLYLSDARRQAPVPGLDDLLTALLALSLDRAGKVDQVRILERELSGVWALERFASPRDRARLARVGSTGASASELPPLAFSEREPLLADGELHAAIACAAARTDPHLARAHLQAYLDGPGGKGPFRDWARERLAALGHAVPP
jgi:hypothetical protein